MPKDNREHYIRYRIYVQTSKKANRDYPKRLQKNLNNLHRNLGPEYTQRDYQNEIIKSKTFIPLELENPGKKYYYLIGYLAAYFECVAVWKKTLIKGTTKTINTFSIYGYEQDMLLAYHYISKIINGLDNMRFNMRREYRRVKVNRRRRGENIRELNNAIVKSSNYFYRKLNDICDTCEIILGDRQFSSNHEQKIETIYKHLIHNRDIQFRAYHYKGGPQIHNAFCRRGKFQNRRIIVV